MAWPHPITTLGVVAGLVAAYLVAVTMSFLDEPRLLSAYLLPDSASDPLGMGDGDDQFVLAILLQLGLGAIIGGLYPWIFHGLLGLSGSWITELPLTIVTGAVLGAAIAALAIVAATVGVFEYRNNDTADFTALGGYLVLFGFALGLLVGLARPVWFDIFLV